MSEVNVLLLKLQQAEDRLRNLPTDSRERNNAIYEIEDTIKVVTIKATAVTLETELRRQRETDPVLLKEFEDTLAMANLALTQANDLLNRLPNPEIIV